MKKQAAGAGVRGAAGGGVPVGPIAPVTPPLPMYTCDASDEGETMCGGQACPELPPTAAASCTIGCCTSDGKCGMRSVARLDGRRISDLCIPVGVPDERCPSSNIAGVAFPGCCDPVGRCGQLFAGTCVSTGFGMACAAAADAGL